MIVEIYIPNIRKKCYTQGIESLTEKERRILVMVETDVSLARKIGKGDKLMEEYIEDAIIASGNVDLRESYDKEEAMKDLGRQEGLEQGREEGLEQGREEGLEQGREEGLEQGREEGLEQGREEGLERGREETKIEIVKKLFARQISINEICEITNLSLQEVEKIKKEMEQ